MKIKLKNNQIILEGMLNKPYYIVGLDKRRGILVVQIPNEIKGYEHLGATHSTSQFLAINLKNGTYSSAVPKSPELVKTVKRLTLDDLILPNDNAFVSNLPNFTSTSTELERIAAERVKKFFDSSNLINPDVNEDEVITKNQISKLDYTKNGTSPMADTIKQQTLLSPEEKVKKGVGDTLPSKQFKKIGKDLNTNTSNEIPEPKKDYSRMKRKKKQFNKLDFDDKSDLIEQKLPFKNFKFKKNSGN